jgi:fluoroacetyl-CoA thioesterase
MVEVGRTREVSRIVSRQDLAPHHGSGGLPVLGTPALIALCEETARLLVDPALPEGQSTVGTAIDFRHTAATPPGMRVTVRATLTEADGRRLRFDLEARDETEEIGHGTHERFVIDVARFEARVAAKEKSDRS